MTAQFSVDLCERLESLSSMAGKLARDEQNSMEVSRAFTGGLVTVSVYPCISFTLRSTVR